MDLLDRLLGHDAWTTRQLLLLCRELTAEQLDQPFDIGHRTVRASLLHIVRNMEVWTDLMCGGPIRPGDADPSNGSSIDGLHDRLNRAADDLGRLARGVAADGRWDALWTDFLDDPPVEKSCGGAIAHIITHSMHHRAQVLFMLRHLGVAELPEGDVFSWENRDGLS
ncbi:MAG: DinB family protein [Planctomycetaceae bacterium]|nr:DinB family protein [Planctomycetaceae bacterium]